MMLTLFTRLWDLFKSTSNMSLSSVADWLCSASALWLWWLYLSHRRDAASKQTAHEDDWQVLVLELDQVCVCVREGGHIRSFRKWFERWHYMRQACSVCCCRLQNGHMWNAVACVGVCSVCVCVFVCGLLCVSWYICPSSISIPGRRGPCSVCGSVGGWWQRGSGNNISMELQLLSADETLNTLCL